MLGGGGDRYVLLLFLSIISLFGSFHGWTIIFHAVIWYLISTRMIFDRVTMILWFTRDKPSCKILVHLFDSEVGHMIISLVDISLFHATMSVLFMLRILYKISLPHATNTRIEKLFGTHASDRLSRLLPSCLNMTYNAACCQALSGWGKINDILLWEYDIIFYDWGSGVRERGRGKARRGQRVSVVRSLKNNL